MEPTYGKELTALLVIDPYNDFISEGGKVWDKLKDVEKQINVSPHVAGPECSTGSEHPRCLCSRDVIASEHWGSSGFANTDLDLQLKGVASRS